MDEGFLSRAAEHGTVGQHPTTDLVALRVGPSTDDEFFNTISIDLVPIACLSLNDILFEFDSSLVNPDAVLILGELPGLRLAHTNPRGSPPLAIFGHADPTGGDEYNKQLSGRRARAIYGLLIRSPAIWEDLMDHPFGGDNWNSAGAIRKMRAVVGPGAPAKRHDLIESYMAVLFPVRLTPQDFLGRGKDSKLRADVQGCSEFNPLRILAAGENKSLSKEDRNALNLVNRRVVIYLFRPGAKADPLLWPCPAATESGAKCHTRFFSNGDQRRAERPERREHVPPQNRKDRLDQRIDDTFACRFYARMANLSPCERILRIYMIRLFDRLANPLPGAPWVLIDAETTRVGFTDPVTAFLTVHNLRVPAQCTVKWNRPPQSTAASIPKPDPNDRFEFEMDVFVDLPDSIDDDSTLARLHNLGYEGGETPQDDIRAFQEDYKDRFPDLPLQPTGQLDPNTRIAAQRANDDCDPVIKEIAAAE